MTTTLRKRFSGALAALLAVLFLAAACPKTGKPSGRPSHGNPNRWE